MILVFPIIVDSF